jgi:hypothetical protein
MAKRSPLPEMAVPSLFPDEAREEASEMRMMFSLPSRFKAKTIDSQMVALFDTASDTEIKIAAVAFGEVRRVLGAFFGGKEEGLSGYVPPADLKFVPPFMAEKDPKAIKKAAQRQISSSASSKASKPPRRSARLQADKQSDPQTAPEHSISPSASEALQPKVASTAPHPAVAKGSTAGKTSAPAKAKAQLAGKVKVEPTAHKKPLESTQSTSGPAASKVPAGWAPVIEGANYTMNYSEIDGDPGYTVIFKGKVFARVRQDKSGKFFVSSPTSAFDPSPHKTVMAAQSRLNVLLD